MPESRKFPLRAEHDVIYMFFKLAILTELQIGLIFGAKVCGMLQSPSRRGTSSTRIIIQQQNKTENICIELHVELFKAEEAIEPYAASSHQTKRVKNTKGKKSSSEQN